MKDHGSVLIVFNRGIAGEFKLLTGDRWTMEFTSAAATLDNRTCQIPHDSVVVLSCPSLALPRDIAEAAIEDEAKLAGIIPEFWDISGHHHAASTETKSAILKAMGDSFRNPLPRKPKGDVKAVYGAKSLKERGKVWGVTAALYGIKSARNWGMGDFEDLAAFAEYIAGKGADFIGINPVHALFPVNADLYAPYSPSSRDFLNVMHIAPDKIDELTEEDLTAWEPNIGKVRKTDFVDYKAVYALKTRAFETAFARFKLLGARHKRRKAFETFVKTEGKALHLHAVFDAIFETLPKKNQTYDGYKNFPKELQSPDSSAVQKFAKDNSERVEYYSYLQWIAQSQLQDAQNRAIAAGMFIGLYLDYAVGVVPGGSDVWRNREVYADGISLGAPGDAANPDGQVWNLVPYNPHKLAANNFDPYRSSLQRIMQQAGAVRIDHILGHMRSFWIPNDEGERHFGGAYLRYPLEGLLDMIAEESQAENCVVIGEDLGTIPDGLRDAMQVYDLMGCGIAIIERDSGGQLIALSRAREVSLTSFSNHDFPTLAGFWEGTDFDWREALGIASDAQALKMERERRQRDKQFLSHQVGYEGSADAQLTAELAADLQAALARSPALAVAVQLEDLLLQSAQPNVPGTTQEQPNWRRKYSADIKSIADHPSAKQIISAMNKARPRKKG